MVLKEELKISPMVLLRKSEADLEVFEKQVSDRLHGIKTQKPPAVKEIKYANLQWEYNNAYKIVVSSQPVTPLSSKDHRVVDEELPVLFVNANEENLIQNDDHTTNADLSFANPEAISVNVLEYAKNNRRDASRF